MKLKILLATVATLAMSASAFAQVSSETIPPTSTDTPSSTSTTPSEPSGSTGGSDTRERDDNSAMQSGEGSDLKPKTDGAMSSDEAGASTARSGEPGSSTEETTTPSGGMVPGQEPN